MYANEMATSTQPRTPFLSVRALCGTQILKDEFLTRDGAVGKPLAGAKAIVILLWTLYVEIVNGWEIY